MKWLMRILGKGKKERAGFTLVELMIVMIIVGILAAAAVPVYRFAVMRAYRSEAHASLGVIRSAEMVYEAEHPWKFLEIIPGGAAPNTLEDLGVDVANNTWFDEDCFEVTVVDGDPAVEPPTSPKFIAKCNGGEGDPKVNGIYVALWNTGEWSHPDTLAELVALTVDPPL